MNKKEYKEVFSKIQPSDEAEERIMYMVNRKKLSGLKRVLITALVAVSLLCTMGVFANAATDGAVSEAISQVVEKVTVIINGKETEQELILEEGVDKDGEPYYKGEVVIADPDGGEYSRIEFEMDGEAAVIGSGGATAEDIDAVISDSFELYIPTTAEAE